MDFEQVSSYLASVSPRLVMWIVAATVVFVLIVVFAFFWRRVVSSKVRGTEGFSGMHFGDVEKMRRTGMISEDEYRAIKRKVAERTLAESKEKASGAEAQLVMLQAAADPDLVRKLLPEESRPHGAKKPASRQAFASPSKEADRIDDEEAGDPLAGYPAAPDAEKAIPAPGKKGELDLLLEKGAITRDQYDQLKGYFKNPE